MPVAWALLAATLAVFIVYLVIYATYARALIQFPFDYDQGEGFEFYDGLRLARGQNIYLDNSVFPYYASNYPPVYRLLLVPLIWLFGPRLAVARALTWGLSLGIGLLIALAARAALRRGWPGLNATRSGRLTLWAVAAIAGLSFFAANIVYEIGPLARAHLPMVFFGLAGILCLERGLAGEAWSRRWATAGIVLLIVAGFTKLQAIDALAAGFGFALLRRPRWAISALLVALGVTAALTLGLNALTGGQFWLNVVAANVNEYDIAVTWQTYGDYLRLQGPLVVGATANLIVELVEAIRHRDPRRLSIWSLFFVTGFAMGMLTGKWGAGPAYLIASIAAAAVGTVRFIAWLGRGARIGTVAPLLLFCALLLAQGWQNLHLPTSGRLFGTLARLVGVEGRSSYPPFPYYDSAGYTQLGHLLDPADVANGWALVDAIRAAEGPVWSEEAMLTLLAGKDVVTNPTQLYNLSKAGMLDTRDMIARIQRREFGLVVFRAQFYPDDVKVAIGQNYRWVRSIKMNGFDYWLLEPNR